MVSPIICEQTGRIFRHASHLQGYLKSIGINCTHRQAVSWRVRERLPIGDCIYRKMTDEEIEEHGLIKMNRVRDELYLCTQTNEAFLSFEHICQMFGVPERLALVTDRINRGRSVLENYTIRTVPIQELEAMNIRLAQDPGKYKDARLYEIGCGHKWKDVEEGE